MEAGYRRSRLLDEVRERGLEGATILEGPEFDGGVIGFTDDRVVYGYEALIRSLSESCEMNEEDAMEYVDYNVVRSLPYMPNPPVLVYGYDLENE